MTLSLGPLLDSIVGRLFAYGLTPDLLRPLLREHPFHETAIEVAYGFASIQGPVGVVVSDRGLTVPFDPFKQATKRGPPLPYDLRSLLKDLKSYDSTTVKQVLHEKTLVTLRPQGFDVTILTVPSDFCEPTYSPIPPRVRVALNTLDRNYERYKKSLKSEVSWMRRNNYPHVNVEQLPSQVTVRSDDLKKDLYRLWHDPNGWAFDFKCPHGCLFILPLACYVVHLEEGRYADFDELYYMCQSKVTLAKYTQTHRWLYSEETFNRRMDYLRESSIFRKEVRKQVSKAVKIGILIQKDSEGAQVYGVPGLSLVDTGGGRLYLPPRHVWERVKLENHMKWHQHPLRSLTEIPGDLRTRVFVGGTGQTLPSQRVIMSLVSSYPPFIPISANDFDIPRDETYQACINLLSGCGQSIFEISEPGGWMLEAPKAIEMGQKVLLVAEEIPSYQGKTMVETMAMRSGAVFANYATYEDLAMSVREFLAGCSASWKESRQRLWS